MMAGRHTDTQTGKCFMSGIKKGTHKINQKYAVERILILAIAIFVYLARARLKLHFSLPGV